MIQVRFKNTHFFSVFMMLLLVISCSNSIHSTESEKEGKEKIIIGAARIEAYLLLIENKRVAIVANQTSVIFKNNNLNTHLVDSLIALNVNITKVFAPEHGFRGKADAAEYVADGKDSKTGLPIISLYGKNKKPSQKQLDNVDIVVFDIQDVGVRFYTYISTLHYVMEACAEKGIPLIVLDRPNPNGHYVDGPMLELKHKSFVGMHPVPLVYGLTIGEYAQMINGQKWLSNTVTCDLTVIELENYTHQSEYHLAVRPSPNLPNDIAINLYPSLGFFEGTPINAGRGTEFQFQRYGAPYFPKSDFTYTPHPNFGSKHPKHQEEICNGVDLNKTPKLSAINLEWLIDAYHKTPKDISFFGKTFTVHAGNTTLQKQIEKGMTAKEIRKSWKDELNTFKEIRKKYLIYK